MRLMPSVLASSWVVAAAAVAASPAAALFAQQGLDLPAGFEIERTDWEARVEEGGSLVVANPFGDVHCRFGGWQGEVAVHAVLQQFAAEGPRLELATEAGKAGARVRVGFRDPGVDQLLQRHDPSQLKRADLTVFVPAGVSLELEVDDGTIDVKGLRGAVRAASRSGDIYLQRVNGAVAAASDSGRVVVTLARGAAKENQRLRTTSGSLELHLPEDADVEVSATTGGHISTDFTMTIDTPSAQPQLRAGRAVVGRGGPLVELQSESGRIMLVRRLPEGAGVQHESAEEVAP